MIRFVISFLLLFLCLGCCQEKKKLFAITSFEFEVLYCLIFSFCQLSPTARVAEADISVVNESKEICNWTKKKQTKSVANNSTINSFGIERVHTKRSKKRQRIKKEKTNTSIPFLKCHFVLLSNDFFFFLLNDSFSLRICVFLNTIIGNHSSCKCIIQVFNYYYFIIRLMNMSSWIWNCLNCIDLDKQCATTISCSLENLSSGKFGLNKLQLWKI